MVKTEIENKSNSVTGISPCDIVANDVLSGRGGRVNSHEGNIRFRELVTAEKLRYLKTNKKKDKAKIAKGIVNKIRSLNGRFLKEDSNTLLWIDIGDERAIRKTGQALREDAPEIREGLYEEEFKLKFERNNNGMTYPMSYMYPPYPFMPYPPLQLQPMDCAPVYPYPPYYYPMPPNQMPILFSNTNNTGISTIPQHQASTISLDNNNNKTMMMPPMNINTENSSTTVNTTYPHPRQQQQMGS